MDSRAAPDAPDRAAAFRSSHVAPRGGGTSVPSSTMTAPAGVSPIFPGRPERLAGSSGGRARQPLADRRRRWSLPGWLRAAGWDGLILQRRPSSLLCASSCPCSAARLYHRIASARSCGAAPGAPTAPTCTGCSGRVRRQQSRPPNVHSGPPGHAVVVLRYPCHITTAFAVSAPDIGPELVVTPRPACLTHAERM